MGKSRIQVKSLRPKQSSNDDNQDTLPDNIKTDVVHSELEFLKKIKLRNQINSYAGVSDSDKLIAGFKSEKDTLIEGNYSSLLALYKSANEQDADGSLSNESDYYKLSHIYREYGSDLSLFQVAVKMADITLNINGNQQILKLNKAIETQGRASVASAATV
jgi:hypothetical protein